MSHLLAREFVSHGHDVTVVTTTRAEAQGVAFPFTVVRAPSPVALLRIVSESDVVFHNNLCAQFAWPLLLIRRPWVVATRTWIRRTDGRITLRDRFKHAVLRAATVISISSAVADHLAVRSTVIPNSYRDDVFGLVPDVERAPGSLVFVGRLVEDKGVSLLLDALVKLKQKGMRPPLSVIGAGPLGDLLRAETVAKRIDRQVTFVGELRGSALSRELNAHDIIVIPSVWDEPFGIVGLEGVAAGCVAVASSGGGLPDAVGECGLLFRNGDVDALADAIERLLTEPELVRSLRSHREGHLADHTATRMGERYLEVIEGAARGERLPLGS